MSLAIFDLDDTLWSRREALAMWAESIAEFEGATLENSVATVLEADNFGKSDRKEFLDQVHFELQLSVSRAAFRRWYKETYPSCFRPFPGVVHALRCMQISGWKLGVASNGNGSRQREKLRLSGLAPFFGAVVSADEVGVRKPDAGIFVKVAERLGCHLDGWVLGDSPEEDVAGAKAVGLRAGWVNPMGNAWEFASEPPDLAAPTAVQLMALISRAE